MGAYKLNAGLPSPVDQRRILQRMLRRARGECRLDIIEVLRRLRGETRPLRRRR